MTAQQRTPRVERFHNDRAQAEGWRRRDGEVPEYADHDEYRVVTLWATATGYSYPTTREKAFARASKFNASPPDHDPQAVMIVQRRRTTAWEADPMDTEG